MQPIIITKEQKKILLIVGIVVLIFILFILFAYLPLRSKQNRLKREINSIESDIEKIRKIAKDSSSIEGAIVVLKNKLESLNSKFPSREEYVLRMLSELAAKMNIEVSSMTPQKKKIVSEISSSSVRVRDASIQEMSVAMNFRTNYKTLADFLKILEEDFPVSLRVESVRMSHRSNTTATLDVNLELDAYLISEK